MWSIDWKTQIGADNNETSNIFDVITQTYVQ